jgi:hypothetical protein
MNEDLLLEQLKARLDGEGQNRVVTVAEVKSFEQSTGLQLPPFYVRLLTEVANGGFGPGFGLIGIPPYVDDDLRSDLREAYLEGRACDDVALRNPEGLLYLCSWGCAIYSYVDCTSATGPVVTDELLFGDQLEFTETSPGLAMWLADWLSGVDLESAMHRVTGYRDGTNPFTRQPIKIPIRERVGRRLDMSSRRGRYISG